MLRQGCIYVSFLSVTDEGTTEFTVKYASDNVLVVYVSNTDEEGNVTELAAILGMYVPPFSHRHGYVTWTMSALLSIRSVCAQHIIYMVSRACLFCFTEVRTLKHHLWTKTSSWGRGPRDIQIFLNSFDLVKLKTIKKQSFARYF